MEFERTRKKRLEISLIPLIDISMFLLIFFMIAGTVEKFEVISINPPLAASGKLVDEGHLVILLGKHNELIIGDEIITLSEAASYLKPLLTQHPGKVITVKADEAAPAAMVIDVMEAIKSSGGEHLSVVTQSIPPDSSQ